MAVKFKVGFTMSAETLFGIIAKFLPVEDLHVEELEPPRKVEKIAELVGPKKRQGHHNRWTGPVLDGGVNGVIMAALADGRVHRYRELKIVVTAAGYSGSGIGSKLAHLRDKKAIHQPEIGHWQIGDAPSTKKSA